MIDLEKDIAIRSLLASAREVAPDLPEDLLIELYKTEKHFQFNADEESRFKAVKNIIDQYIDSQIGR